MGKRKNGEDPSLESMDFLRSNIKRFKKAVDIIGKKRSRAEEEDQDQDEYEDEDEHVVKYHKNSQDESLDEGDTDEGSIDGISSSSNTASSSSSGAAISSEDSEDESEDYETDSENDQMIMSSPSVNNFLHYRDLRTPDSLAFSNTPGTAGTARTTDSLEGLSLNYLELSPVRLNVDGLNLENEAIAADEQNYASFYGLTTVGIAMALVGLADFCG